MFQRTLRIAEWRQAVRTAHQAGKQRRLGQVEVRGGFAEIGAARRLDTEETRSEIDPVHVVGDDFFLAENRFHAHGKGSLKNLAVNVLSPEGKTVAGKLLGERASPLAHSAGSQIAERRPGDAHRIDPEMVEEARVLADHERAHEIGADAGKWNGAPVFPAEARVDLAVAVNDQRTIPDATDLRQIERPGPGQVKARNQPP